MNIKHNEEFNVTDTTQRVKELYDFLSHSNHWLIHEEVNNVHIVEDDGVMSLFYEKNRKFDDFNNRSLAITVILKKGCEYKSLYDRTWDNVIGCDTSGESSCDIYTFVNKYIPMYPEQTNAVDLLKCELGDREFEIDPSSDGCGEQLYRKILYMSNNVEYAINQKDLSSCEVVF